MRTTQLVVPCTQAVSASRRVVTDLQRLTPCSLDLACSTVNKGVYDGRINARSAFAGVLFVTDIGEQLVDSRHGAYAERFIIVVGAAS